MKVRFISLSATLLSVFSLSAATVPLYINSSDIASPPASAPQIDATTFVNQAYFEVDDLSLNPLPYETTRTLNFRNDPAGQMYGHPGYFFEYVNGNTRGRMSTWLNRGSISSFTGPTNQFFTFTTANWLLVSSDNITNSGFLNASPTGLLRLDGNTINLTRGRLRSGAPLQAFVSGTGGAYLFDTNYFNDPGITDVYWGAGSNNVVRGAGTLMPLNSTVPNFSVTNLESAIHEVIQSFGPFLSTNQTILPSFFGPKGVTTSSYVSTNLGANEILVQVVFVATNFFDTNLTTDITFYPGGFGGSAPAPATVQVGFNSVDRDVALDVNITNSVYVIDGMALRTNVALIPNIITSAGGRRPDTYEVSKAPFRQSFSLGQPGNSSLTNFPLYRSSYASNAVSPIYAAYSAQLTAQSLTGSDPTNLPGRIEIWGQDVNLREARVRAESTFILTANNLVSNNQARVSAPFLCFDIGTTQPQLLISNLAPPTVNRLYGTVSAWSAMWDNSDANIPGMTIRFHVLIVDHNLQTTQPVTVSKFFGRGPQIVLADPLSVNQRLRMDANSLYVKAGGGLSFPPNWSWGSSNMVNILSFTNDGIVNVPGMEVLGTDRGYPYANLINRGTNVAQSFSISANDFENYGAMLAQGNTFSSTGTNLALRGWPFSRQLQITTNIFFTFPATLTTNYTTNIVYPGAAAIITDGDLSLTANFMSFSNALLQAGDGVQGSLSITANTRLTDAGPSVTNYWITSGGINVPKRPTQFSDLMGTYAAINAPADSEVTMAWDGKNLGTTVMGYSNNLALAKLTLDGGPGSVFHFAGIPSKDNALYVDYLELLNNATNFADPAVFSFDSNFRIYFANANVAAKKLNGAQNDHIRWISSFTGPLSTTNIVYPSGNVYPVNIQLARYPDFDSDGDGIPNHKDPTPIYVAESINLAIGRTATNRVLLSWQALANSTSYIEYKPSLAASAWQLLRSTTAPANMRISTTDTPLTGRTQRIYRVRVDLPPQ